MQKEWATSVRRKRVDEENEERPAYLLARPARYDQAVLPLTAKEPLVRVLDDVREGAEPVRGGVRVESISQCRLLGSRGMRGGRGWNEGGREGERGGRERKEEMGRERKGKERGREEAHGHCSNPSISASPSSFSCRILCSALRLLRPRNRCASCSEKWELHIEVDMQGRFCRGRTPRSVRAERRRDEERIDGVERREGGKERKQ